MTRVTDDVRDLLGPDDPAPVDPPDLSALRFRVLERLDEPDAGAEPWPVARGSAAAGRHHGRAHRSALVAVTIAVLAAAVVLARRTSTSETGSTRAELSGPAVLQLPLDEPAGPVLVELADTAEARGLAPLTDGEYWYRSQARWDLFPDSDGLDTRRQLQLSELWRDGDGNRFGTTAGGPLVVPGAATQVTVDARPDAPPPQQALPLPSLHPDGPLLRPGGVEAAVAHVLTDGEEPFKSFFGALDILQERVLPGEQLAEMYRLLAGIDGIRYRGRVVDRAGRGGEAFTIRWDEPAGDPVLVELELLIVDPADGRPLEIDTVIEHGSLGDVTAPAVEWFTVFLDVGKVDRPGDRPTSRLSG